MNWNIDTLHTGVEFSVRHMMVTTVRGQVHGVTGTIDFDPASPETAAVDATIDISTITTGVPDRDAHLRSADFFNVAQYPAVTFKSTSVKATGENEALLTGDLTIAGVTKPVDLTVTFLGTQVDTNGKTRAGFEAETKLDREDFGLTWNVALEAGGMLVAREVKISLFAQGILVTEQVTA